MVSVSSINGRANGNGHVEIGFHSGSRTTGYQPTLGAANAWGIWDADGAFNRGDIELMDMDPRVWIGFRILCAPVAAASWTIKCDNPSAAAFIDKTITHFWQHDLTRALGMLKYGSQGGELVYRQDPASGHWHYDTLKDFHINDVRPLDLHGTLAGIRVYNVLGDDGRKDERRNGEPPPTKGGRGLVDLPYPSCFWVANEPKFSGYYGQSRYQGAWKPWKEKRGKHGAIDVRRTWFLKNVYHGGMMRYPEGQTEVAAGVWKDNQDIAREIVEKAETGNVEAMPGAFDVESGKFLWDYIYPKPNGEIPSLLEYPKTLDVEILEGMGIWPEVLQASEVGAGWSGRAIPFFMFLGSEDDIVRAVLMAFVRQAVRPLVAVNFGAEVRFEVEAVSLLPKEDASPKPQQQQGQQGQQQPPGGQQPPQGGAPQPEALMGRPSAGGAEQGVGLSTDAGGREHKPAGEGGGQFTRTAREERGRLRASLETSRKAVHGHARGAEKLEAELAELWWEHPDLERLHDRLSATGGDTFDTVLKHSGLSMTHPKNLADRKRDFRLLEKAADKAISYYPAERLDEKGEADRGKIMNLLRRVKVFARQGFDALGAVASSQEAIRKHKEDSQGVGLSTDAPSVRLSADRHWVTIGGKDGGTGGHAVLVDVQGNIVGGDVPKEWHGKPVHAVATEKAVPKKKPKEVAKESPKKAPPSEDPKKPPPPAQPSRPPFVTSDVNHDLPDGTRAYLDRATPDELKALHEYTGGHAYQINTALWNGQPLRSAALQQEHATLQGMFAKNPDLPDPVLVYRGVNSSPQVAAQLVAKMQALAADGQPWTSKGYVSTTTAQADTAGSPLSMTIKARNGVDTTPLTKGDKSEKEMMLGADTQYAIRSVAKREDGGWHVELEQLAAPKAVRLSADWNEAQHNRGQPDNAGQFGPGGGGEERASVEGKKPEGEKPAHHATVAVWFGKSDLPDETKAHYAATAVAVLDKMPDGLRKAALEALAEYGGKVVFYADVATVTAALEKDTGKKEKAKVGGWVKHHAGGDASQLHLDGGAGAADDSTAFGIYAHELGHCVDVGRKYSKNPGWEAAWKKEIKGGKIGLSRYALTSATEGFAELHRAIVQKGVEAVKASFPKCVAFLAAQGLV